MRYYWRLLVDMVSESLKLLSWIYVYNSERISNSKATFKMETFTKLSSAHVVGKLLVRTSSSWASYERKIGKMDTAPWLLTAPSTLPQDIFRSWKNCHFYKTRSSEASRCSRPMDQLQGQLQGKHELYLLYHQRCPFLME